MPLSSLSLAIRASKGEEEEQKETRRERERLVHEKAKNRLRDIILFGLLRSFSLSLQQLATRVAQREPVQYIEAEATERERSDRESRRSKGDRRRRRNGKFMPSALRAVVVVVVVAVQHSEEEGKPGVAPFRSLSPACARETGPRKNGT